MPSSTVTPFSLPDSRFYPVTSSLFFYPAFCWTKSELQLLKSVFQLTLFAAFASAPHFLTRAPVDAQMTTAILFSPCPPHALVSAASVHPVNGEWRRHCPPGKLPRCREFRRKTTAAEEHRGHFRPDNESSCRPVSRARHRRDGI